MLKRFFALLLCAATLLTTFVGCAKKDDEYKGQYITTYLTDNIYDLDPVHAYKNEAVSNVVSLLFDTLFKLDAKGKVQKSLVKDYKIKEDPKAGEYIMELRLKNTNWSDGTAVSANDIVFAWKRLLEVDSNQEAASLLFDIKNARAAKEGDASIDDVGIYATEQRVLEIRFEGPIDYDHFMMNLTSLALAPLRDDIVGKSDDWAKKPGTMVCSGPFKLARINFKNTDTKYFDDKYVETDVNGFETVGKEFFEQVVTDFSLERNVYYYRDAEEDKLMKSVTPFRIAVDCSLTPEQLDAAYDAGMILYVSDVPMALRKDSKISADVEVSDRSLSTNSVYLNQHALIQKAGSETGEALFANADVRKALSMAIDRAALADAVVYAEAATGLVPSGVFEAGSPKSLFRAACTEAYEALKTDMSAAKSLLSKAGINPADYTFTLTYAAYDEVHKFIAETIAKEWTDLGFHVTANGRGTIVNNDYYKYTDSTPVDICDDLYAEDFRASTFEAILVDDVAFSADPFSVLSSYAKRFSGRAMDMSNPEDYHLTPHITGYDSEAYNELMEKIFAEKTISKRADMYREAEKILMEDMPVIPVLFNKTATVQSGDLKKTTTSFYNVTNFQKSKVSSYEDYIAVGKKYITDNFSEMKFTECIDCPYKDFEIFKTSNTVYTHFFLDEKEKASKPASTTAAETTKAA